MSSCILMVTKSEYTCRNNDKFRVSIWATMIEENLCRDDHVYKK